MAASVYLRNSLSKGVAVLLNGTGGGAPALDENADWPTRYTLSPDRYQYWRALAGGLGPAAGTYLFDYDYGAPVTLAVVGWGMMRQYPQQVEVGNLVLECYWGSSYPPTNALGVGLGCTGNDSFAAFTPTAARYWRVELQALDGASAPLEVSGKPWLVEAADVLALRAPGPASSSTRVAVEEATATEAGYAHRYRPGVQERASVALGERAEHPLDDGVVVAALGTTLMGLEGRVVLCSYEGDYLEGTLEDGTAGWERVFNTIYSTAMAVRGTP